MTFRLVELRSAPPFPSRRKQRDSLPSRSCATAPRYRWGRTSSCNIAYSIDPLTGSASNSPAWTRLTRRRWRRSSKRESALCGICDRGREWTRCAVGAGRVDMPCPRFPDGSLAHIQGSRVFASIEPKGFEVSSMGSATAYKQRYATCLETLHPRAIRRGVLRPGRPAAHCSRLGCIQDSGSLHPLRTQGRLLSL